MNPLRRVWHAAKRVVEGYFGYPANPYPPFYRPGDAERRDFFSTVVAVDRWERRRGGNQLERLTDERIVVMARSLHKYNPFAKAILSALRSYVLGDKGLQIACVAKNKDDPADAHKAQAWCDRFKKRNDWWDRERETFVRAHRDGDAILRFGVAEDGEIVLRPIEPEFCRSDGSIEFEQGVRVDPEDAETPLEYAVEYTPGNFTYVPADEVFHVKLNVDKVMKRGVSDFACNAKILEQTLVAVKNMISGEATRQGNAWVTEHAPGTERAAIQGMGGDVVNWGGQTDPNGETMLSQITEGVSVLHLSSGQTLAATPGAETINGCVAAINQALQSAVTPYRMPLAVVTGDTSRNNAVGSDTDHPFSNYIADEQALFCNLWRKLFEMALEWGRDEGQLDGVDFDKFDVIVTPQAPITRDPKAAAEVLKILEDDDIISKKTRTVKSGYEFDQEQEQIRKERESGADVALPSLPKGRVPVTLPLPPQNGQQTEAAS